MRSPSASASAVLVQLMRDRYSVKEYALLFEVRNRTGYGGNVRTADAIAVSLWPSRGIEVIGFEFKVSRGDWLREKKEPEKAEEICKYCDRWYVVTSEDGIVADGELPTSWGLLVPESKKGNTRLATRVEAPKLEPQALTKTFVASLLRNVSEAQSTWIPRSSMADELEAAREKGRQDGESAVEYRVRHSNEAFEKLQAGVKAFEEASGLKIDAHWAHNNHRLGAAVKLVLAGGVEAQRRELEDILSKSRRVTEVVQAALEDRRSSEA